LCKREAFEFQIPIFLFYSSQNTLEGYEKRVFNHSRFSYCITSRILCHDYFLDVPKKKEVDEKMIKIQDSEGERV
jgi:hypothetical protein